MVDSVLVLWADNARAQMNAQVSRTGWRHSLTHRHTLTFHVISSHYKSLLLVFWFPDRIIMHSYSFPFIFISRSSMLMILSSCRLKSSDFPLTAAGERVRLGLEEDSSPYYLLMVSSSSCCCQFVMYSVRWGQANGSLMSGVKSQKERIQHRLNEVRKKNNFLISKNTLQMRNDGAFLQLQRSWSLSGRKRLCKKKISVKYSTNYCFDWRRKKSFLKTMNRTDVVKAHRKYIGSSLIDRCG